MQCFPLSEILLGAVKRPSVDRSVEMVKLLLEHSADIDVTGGDGAVKIILLVSA